MFTVVAAPPKLIVVAAVLSSANVVDAVVKLVVIAGEVPNTATPVPVSLVRAASNWAEVNEPSEVAFPTDVTAPVKFAFTVAVPVPFPVPPFAIARTPATVTAPEVADDGVKPVVPNETVVTGVVAALLASNLTVPAEFLKYNFSSTVLSANSPATRLAEDGVAAAVVV
jgi:hypothetical protein